MVVKEMLKYKQKGDRTEHWVREGSKSTPNTLNSWHTMTINPMQWSGSWGNTLSTGTATQLSALANQQQQAYQQYYQPFPYGVGFGTTNL